MDSNTTEHDSTPKLPPRPDEGETLSPLPSYNELDLPTYKTSMHSSETGNPIHYSRNPHKLVAYLIPFPKPQIPDADKLPDRFMIYTPPLPLVEPKEGEKEGKTHKLQREWQNEVREAKKSDAKVTSWKGVKSLVTKGISTAMSRTTTSNLDFLNRIPGQHENQNQSKTKEPDSDGLHSNPATKKTTGLEEMILIYPEGMPGSEKDVRAEFVNSMLRSKIKAQRDAIIATGLLPVSFAIDMLLIFIWPFGGLLEIDAVWAYSSFRGAKTVRSVTKRLHSSTSSDDEHSSGRIRLSFMPSPGLEVLKAYLAAECHKRDPTLFRSAAAPTESEIVQAIGWSRSQTGGETSNWEDEQWEVTEVKDDLRVTMRKAAREWDKWLQCFQKDATKARQGRNSLD